MNKKHHVLLITIDCGRADHILGSRALTPNMDNLCRDGITFNHAYCQANTTIPSLYSIFTSNYLATHGLYSNTRTSPLSPESLPKILQKNNWATAAHAGMPFIQYSLGQELDNRFPFGKSIYQFALKLSSRFPGLRQFLRLNRQNATALTQSSLKWMVRAAKKNNCFLWIHFFDAHIPYYAPKNFILEDFPDLEKLHSATSSLRDQLAKEKLFNPLARSPMAEVHHDISYFPRLYRTALRYIDRELGYLFEQLKLMRMYDDTLIMVTSDHGENLTEYGVYCHHRKLFNTTVHVPLILKDFKNERAGTQINDIVQHIDVAPTILNRLQMAVPEKFQGKNLWPLILGTDYSTNECAICEHAHNYQRSIRTKDWLYIESERDPAKHIALISPRDHSDEFPTNEPDFLLDRNDPEERNLWNELPDVVKKLSVKMEEILGQNREDQLPHEDLPESLKSQLEGLGYF